MMTHMKNLLTILLILLPLSAHAWGVVVSSGGVAAPAGCSEGSGHILIGSSSLGGMQSSHAGNYVIFNQYTAIHTCDVATVLLSVSSVSGTVHHRVAIYADNGSDAPTGSALASSPEVSISGSGNSSHTLSAAYGITEGTKYWLAEWADGTVSVNMDSVGGAVYYQSAAYSSSGSFPTVSSPSSWNERSAIWGLSE